MNILSLLANTGDGGLMTSHFRVSANWTLSESLKLAEGEGALLESSSPLAFCWCHLSIQSVFHQASAHTSFFCRVIIKSKKQNTHSEWLPRCIVCYHLLSFMLRTGELVEKKEARKITVTYSSLWSSTLFPSPHSKGYHSILKPPLTPSASCSLTSEFLMLILPSLPCHTPSLPSSLTYVQLAISPAPEHSNNSGMVPMSQI